MEHGKNKLSNAVTDKLENKLLTKLHLKTTLHECDSCSLTFKNIYFRILIFTKFLKRAMNSFYGCRIF